MNKLYLILFLILSCIFNSFCAYAESELKIQVQIRPPFFTENEKTGEINGGILYTLIRKILKDANISYVIENLPLPRSFFEIKQNKTQVCYPAGVINDERKKFANFSIPYFRDKKFVAIVRKSDKRFLNNETVTNLLQNKKLILIIKLGYSYSEYIDSKFLKIKDYDVHSNTQKNIPDIKITSLSNIEMLSAIEQKGADYLFMGGNESDYLLKSNKNFQKELKIINLNDIESGAIRHFMCSKMVQKETIEKINNSIKKIIKN
ncbi:substrate-binding periplasmic protein [Fluviispira multicolorata]|uniref:Transporter substrate-binding domain-containing protein n=1 Tax=Fluviispira multicolorata TaxID=2654512 RepID=A0A833N3F5_9BACT|nr:transporter substrate-binding domain-containing protein [Fluviispira multicolorata]KAB8029849.1 transporter substrate-binding domain-containing protein [Fluviispira multicolorata]